MIRSILPLTMLIGLVWATSHLPPSSPNDLVVYVENEPVEMTRLVKSCFESIPDSYRMKCYQEAVSTFERTLYPNKRQCCSRWAHIDCLQKYVFNAIYCNQHQSAAVQRYLNELERVSLSPTGNCYTYPPLKYDRKRMKLTGEPMRCIPRGDL
ncbi:hypothetical protein RDWZM_002087 [Blomia tropicalis]|uniref:Uncharacterized protein n=1 Tax=Blomia tropicalis TaxID=40697 RepID=A0A9Q0MFF9_BLOTA|nr:hypothetical protein RDWZM_002087 [Blomia tropicalis]